jgi:hypothetical protein
MSRCRYTALIFVDLVPAPAHGTPPDDFPPHIDLKVRVFPPQYPSRYHVAAVAAEDISSVTSVLHAHNFFGFYVRFSCAQLCLASRDSDLLFHDHTSPLSRAIAFSVHFTPESGAVVVSPPLVVGISSDLMSLANLTLNHIVGARDLADSGRCLCAVGDAAAAGGGGCNDEGHSCGATDESTAISLQWGESLPRCHAVQDKNRDPISISSNSSSISSSSSSSSRNNGNINNSNEDNSDPLPASPPQLTPPPPIPPAAFTSHHCTQLQHALTSGKPPPPSPPHAPPPFILHQATRSCPLAIHLGPWSTFYRRSGACANLRICAGRAVDSFITAILWLQS